MFTVNPVLRTTARPARAFAHDELAIAFLVDRRLKAVAAIDAVV